MAPPSPVVVTVPSTPSSISHNVQYSSMPPTPSSVVGPTSPSYSHLPSPTNLTSPSTTTATATTDKLTTALPGWRAKVEWVPGFSYVWSYLFDRDLHIHLLGLWLFLLYTAYQPIQSLQTLRYPSVGSYNLAIVWGVFGTSSWLAPLWVSIIGPAACLPLSGLLTIVFPLTLIANNDAASLIGAACFGLGAGTLWPSAGRVIASISTNKDETTNAGLFQTYYRGAALVGGLVLAGMNAPDSTWNSEAQWKYQYMMFAACTLLGVLVGVYTWWSYNREMRAKDQHLSRRMHELITELTAAGRTADAEQVRANMAVKKISLNAILQTRWQTWKTTARLAITAEYIPIALLQLTFSGMAQAWFSGNFNLALSNLSTGHTTNGVSWVGWFAAIDQSIAIIAATIAGITLNWGTRTYEQSRRRVMYPIYYGMFACWLAYGLSIYVVHLYAEVGVLHIGWSRYFATVFFTCFFYWTGLMAIEVSYYVFNITLFGPIGVSAFTLRAWFEGIGNMIGYLINNQLQAIPHRKKHWPIILYCVTVVPLLVTLFYFKLPTHYTAHDVIKQRFVAQSYKHESEALDIAQREAEARRSDNGKEERGESNAPNKEQLPEQPVEKSEHVAGQ